MVVSRWPKSYRLPTRHRATDYMVPTFPDWQNSLTFPIFVSIFLVFFKCFLTENFIHVSKQYTVHLYITKITNNIFLKFPEFTRILCHFPRLFQSVQNSLTFSWLENAFPFFLSQWELWINMIYKLLFMTRVASKITSKPSGLSQSCSVSLMSFLRKGMTFEALLTTKSHEILRFCC